MSVEKKWVIDPRREPMWQAPDASRKLNLLIGPDACGAEYFAAGTFHLAPGCETMPDIHPQSEELYYVVSGSGRLVMDGEEFRVEGGMAVYIPAGVEHQSFNDGEEDLVYFYVFGPPEPGAPRQDREGWLRLQ